METEHRTSSEPNFRRCDVLDVWRSADSGHFVSWGAEFKNSEITICPSFRLTVQTVLASITPRVFNAEIDAFMTPKYCGSSCCELGRPSRPSSDRYRRRLRGRGLRRECGCLRREHPGADHSGQQMEAFAPDARSPGSGEGRFQTASSGGNSDIPRDYMKVSVAA